MAAKKRNPYRHKPYTYKAKRRFVCRCSNCRQQFTAITRDGGFTAECPHCGHVNTRAPYLPPGCGRRA